MKFRGVVYDVGVRFGDEGYSVEPFNPLLVEHGMKAIANDLHANSVRIEGEEIERLVTATRFAHKMGLAVFYNPWKMNADMEATSAYFQKAAKAAESLRIEGIEVVFVAVCEYTIFNKGIFPGDTFTERVTWFAGQLPHGGHLFKDMPEILLEKSKDLNKFLATFAETIRAEFHGQLTYSSGTWETVDWSIFDIVGIDYYRRGETEEDYIAGLNHYRLEKPLAVMEVGCCAYKGAAARGDGGFVLLKGTNPDGTGIFQDDIVPSRNEEEQADFMRTQLGLLSNADIHAAFPYVFSFPLYPVGEGARDLDMMSFSLVKTFPDQDPRSKEMPPWAPKEAFHAVATEYRRITASQYAQEYLSSV